MNSVLKISNDHFGLWGGTACARLNREGCSEALDSLCVIMVAIFSDSILLTLHELIDNEDCSCRNVE
jgi:hypothetical protein